jgi:phospholipid/cholesterol/gamma-HCH transport system ATP-binding protein
MAITLRSVAKQFDGRSVLADVTLEIPTGQSTVLVGPSASGKTVLLKCLLGLMATDGGEIAIDGVPVDAGDADAQEALFRRTGVLFQQNALLDSLPVWENVAFRLINSDGMGRRAARDLAMARLATVGLTPAMGLLHPAELSGGMQKRVAVARAMAADPDILVLDDPTAGLDPILTNAVLDLIERNVAGRGVTVLAVTGDMKAARSRFDHLAMLYDGAIRWSGPRDAIAGVDDPYVRQMVDGKADGPIRMRLRD